MDEQRPACHHPGLSCRGYDVFTGGKEFREAGADPITMWLMGVAFGLLAARVLPLLGAGLETELMAFMGTDDNGMPLLGMPNLPTLYGEKLNELLAKDAVPEPYHQADGAMH